MKDRQRQTNIDAPKELKPKGPRGSDVMSNSNSNIGRAVHRALARGEPEEATKIIKTSLDSRALKEKLKKEQEALDDVDEDDPDARKY